MPPINGLATLDYAVIAAYLIAIIAFGLLLTRRRATTEDFFLASRGCTWPVIGLALLASNISSTTLIGLAGAAYGTGISVYNYEWMAAVVLVFFSIFFLPFLLRSRVYTLPEYLERRYNGTARLYFSGLTLFLNIVVDTSSALYGGALLFKLLLPDVPLWQIVIGLALSAGIYTIAGGLRAVIYTEVIQALLLLGASMIIAVKTFAAAGGWDRVMAAVDPAKLSLIRPLDDPTLPWLGLLTGVPLLGFYFWCTNQFMVQRVLTAKDENHGRWGSLFAGFLKLPVLFLMVLPGTAAILLYPGLESPDMVYPTLLLNLLPAGLAGIAVAGFMAALMSSIASTYNSASTLFTMDFVLRRWPSLSNRALVRIGRVVTLVMAVASVLWAPQIERFGSLWQYLQIIIAYAVPPVMALYLVGLFWRRANAAGAIACIATGVVAGIALFLAVPVQGLFTIHFLYIAPLLFLACTLALVVGSLATAPDPAAKSAGMIWTPAFYREESARLAGEPFWRNYRVLAAALLALTAVIVWNFR
ncbi:MULTISPECIES: sodium:solute symporter [unclassified Azospirillum]|uniref:sodium:solute symporter n=1 Tax=unclassified Azospirillum TaxID=2630922 RepID=UPI000B6B9C12|nr:MULTISPECIES: sodium:solute symporter [unclassified Azospirillum]SNS70197.1 solute:Na+ symporter, SSS family [Azospirillum sp. RU38E]SNS88555.1 solute:Na+ symporter, SSS family [Azospirillum sp. RU37A]